MTSLIRSLLVSIYLIFPSFAFATQLTVSAAASLTDACKEIGKAYQAVHPDVTVRFNFAASGLLLQQIRQGAPVDVFLSADEKTVDDGGADDLFDLNTRKDFASNSLVLIVPGDQSRKVGSLTDLSKPEVKLIAIGKTATVPVGRYTEQALQNARLWETLKSKFIQADSVRQALDYVARGEVDAGFVYRTDALLMAEKIAIVQSVGGHDAVTYPVVAVKASQQKNEAKEFIAFLLTPQGQAILRHYGFSPSNAPR